MYDNKISKCKRSPIINQKGKKCINYYFCLENETKGISKIGIAVSNISKLKTLITRENSPRQKLIANSLNTSVAEINKKE